MPKKNNGYTQVKAHANQDRKRREAFARQDKYEAISLEDKISKVTARGGSKRELKRLTVQLPTIIVKELTPATAPVVTPTKRKRVRRKKS